GTLSGNPIAMSAGLKTLELISEAGFHEKLTATTSRLLEGACKLAKQHGIGFSTNQVGGMFGLFFTDLDKVTSFSEVMRCDSEKFSRFFHAMLDAGVYLAPSAFEAGFVSSAHSDEDIDETLAAIDKAFTALQA
ncbi:MAG: aminotransferase class III-fold pyridoxal phosphate-dependent enzyme, partial [Gammaproteobacteria bacterium]|nr:aminotransferase class III-fold pyridoxal phosphate-dependent enzyme [Gammaproteobacteria bacterium]